MIGLIPRVWMICIESLSDADTVRAVLRAAQVPQDLRFALDQPYDDAIFLRVVDASAQVLGMSHEALVDAFARTFIDDAVKRWPVWFEMSPTARDFLERQPRIHASFSRSLTRQTDDSPHSGSKFDVQAVEGGLDVVYQSANRMCSLYKALARTLMAHYGDRTGSIRESRCMHDGADSCHMHVRWPTEGVGAGVQPA